MNEICARVAMPIETMCPAPFDNPHSTALFRCAFLAQMPMMLSRHWSDL